MIGVLAAGLLLAGCSSADEPDIAGTSTATGQTMSASPEATATGPVTPTVTGDVITDLAAPWSIAFLTEDLALMSERDSARILRAERAGTGWQVAPLTTVPGVSASGEGGLMGLAVAPDGDSVYAMFTSATDNRVVRMAWDGNGLGEPQPILTGLPRNSYHNGGRIAFGPDGNLYVPAGDAGQAERAQDTASLAGKILRVTPDGAIPGDNPIPGSPVWSWGHRNVQGLAWDDEGRLWASEFGAKDYDELNIIEPGGNYGWPIVEGPSDNPDLIAPVAWWSPTATASPSGIAISDGAVWVATLRGQTLYQVPITDSGAGEPIAWFTDEYGRLRDVVAAPGGGLWLLTNNTDGRGDPRAGDDRVIGLSLS